MCQSFQTMVSKYICRPCNRKFLAAESLRVLAKASYDKCRAVQARPPSVHVGSPKSSKVAPRKRSKDTSGIGVSPHTHRARPPAKRQTGGTSGQRRRSFPVQGESKTMFTNSYKIILKGLFPIATVPSEPFGTERPEQCSSSSYHEFSPDHHFSAT